MWSYDFVSDHTIDGGQLRILNVIDECTREALGSYVGRHIGARQGTRFLAKLFERHGAPKYIRADNGREFIADHVRDWLKEHGVTPVHIEKGKPQQNCYIERFNGTMRNELLNGETLHSVLEARVVVVEFLELYNTRRPHRGLGMKTPAAYGKMMRNALDNDSCEGGE